jgi:hypothetical protein
MSKQIIIPNDFSVISSKFSLPEWSLEQIVRVTEEIVTSGGRYTLNTNELGCVQIKSQLSPSRCRLDIISETGVSTTYME